MPDKITENALLLCDKGVKPSQLKVTSQNFCKADGKLIATQEDKQAETNIPNFGTCAITKSSCSPSIIIWDKITAKDEINSLKLLTEDSACQCLIGGKISIKNKGHGEKHSLE